MNQHFKKVEANTVVSKKDVVPKKEVVKRKPEQVTPNTSMEAPPKKVVKQKGLEIAIEDQENMEEETVIVTKSELQDLQEKQEKSKEENKELRKRVTDWQHQMESMNDKIFQAEKLKTEAEKETDEVKKTMNTPVLGLAVPIKTNDETDYIYDCLLCPLRKIDKVTIYNHLQNEHKVTGGSLDQIPVVGDNDEEERSMISTLITRNPTVAVPSPGRNS